MRQSVLKAAVTPSSARQELNVSLSLHVNHLPCAFTVQTTRRVTRRQGEKLHMLLSNIKNYIYNITTRDSAVMVECSKTSAINTHWALAEEISRWNLIDSQKSWCLLMFGDVSVMHNQELYISIKDLIKETWKSNFSALKTVIKSLSTTMEIQLVLREKFLRVFDSHFNVEINALNQLKI